MKDVFKKLFTIEKHPVKGLMAYECVVLAYLAATLTIVAVMHSQLPNAHSMAVGRLHVVAITLALWGVYRMLPCGMTRTLRAAVQLALLSWWYPDIYELNRLLPNLDHLFATWEQSLFGCQPALLFSQVVSHPVVSELMCLGYVSYFPMMAVVALSVLLWRYEAFDRVVFVIITTFFIHYVVFIVLPVTGPQYYYQATGLDDIAQGVFPNLHDYFNHHTERMACPGMEGGFFHNLVDSATTPARGPWPPSPAATWGFAPCSCSWCGATACAASSGASCHSPSSSSSPPSISAPTTPSTLWPDCSPAPSASSRSWQRREGWRGK